MTKIGKTFVYGVAIPMALGQLINFVYFTGYYNVGGYDSEILSGLMVILNFVGVSATFIAYAGLVVALIQTVALGVNYLKAKTRKA